MNDPLLEILQVDKLEILKVAATQLKNVPFAKIYKLVADLGFGNMISFKVPRDALILRFRPDEKTPFYSKSQLSYNPDPNTFGRVNLPHEPMFYGSILVPNTLNPMETNTWELIHILQSGGYKIHNGEFEFTMGRWKLKADMPVFSIGFSQIEVQSSSLFLSIYEKFRKINTERSIKIVKFYANEFCKTNINSPSDYKITATASKLLFEKSERVEALIYPSVRSYKLGYNIALTPKFVDRYLELDGVAKVKLYVGKYCLVDVEKECTISKNGTYDLKKTKFTGKGREWCLRKLEEMNNL